MSDRSRAIINDQTLPVGIRLSADALHGFGEESGLVEGGNDHTDQRLAYFNREITHDKERACTVGLPASLNQVTVSRTRSSWNSVGCVQV